ncbi:MAG: ABC transporter substrate-binding protein [Gracilimonas sp.]|nr:ABC transporter substrate-binding protein [Gracilimonas sp.]
MQSRNILILFAGALLWASCGPSLETTTVQTETSELLGNPDSVAVASDDEEEFVQVSLGEIAPIHSLDPLFATSDSELRINNLVYEQLIGIDQFGNPVPELAKRWEVNEDSTQFIFHLRTDIYFHDSQVFGAGNGRRFIAEDVKFIFERMASDDVPAFTANRFSDIRGFNAYHREQTLIKDPSKRVIESIEGLRVRNDSTVVFFMSKPASDLLKRLAHPQASVYAKESIPEKPGAIQQAAGTGRFQLVKKDGNTIILTVNSDYRGVIPSLNRLDIVSGLEERDLYQDFARRDLDGLIEVSYPTLKTITDSTAQLIDQFTPMYQLLNSGVHTMHTVYFNRESGQAKQVNRLLRSLNTIHLLRSTNWGEVTLDTLEITGAYEQKSIEQFVATQNEHFNARMLFNNLASESAAKGFSFTMNASYAPTRFTTFTSLNYEGTIPVIQWQAPIFILLHRNISGVNIENSPWELDLTSIKVSGDS